MGKEAQVRAVLADGADEGRLQYEPPKLIFRGAWPTRARPWPACGPTRATSSGLMAP
jgi:hypothetical protein